MGILKEYSKIFRLKRSSMEELYFPCKRGQVFEHSKTAFGVYLQTSKPRLVFNSIQKRWPAVKKLQHGDSELYLVFEPRSFEEGKKFLRSIRTHRRRQYSDEALEKLKGQVRKMRQNLPQVRPISKPRPITRSKDQGRS